MDHRLRNALHWDARGYLSIDDVENLVKITQPFQAYPGVGCN